MSFTSLISRSLLQRLHLFYSLFSLSNSSHSCSLLSFYFSLYLSPLILLPSEPFISVFLASSCNESPAHLLWFLLDISPVCCSLWVPPSDSFVVVRTAQLTEADTNCHWSLAKQIFRMPGPSIIYVPDPFKGWNQILLKESARMLWFILWVSWTSLLWLTDHGLTFNILQIAPFAKKKKKV